MRLPEAFVRGGRSRRAGFSLVEVMIALTLLAMVVAVVLTVLIGSQRSKADTESRIEAQQGARAISDLIAQDLRTAGYRADTDANPDQPAFAYVDSIECIIASNMSPTVDTTVVAGVPIYQQPQAYNPLGTPKPFFLTATTWTPPVKYGTGAELIRYTLDLNNDGVVNASDQAVGMGAEAQRTANPNDYVLARAVYGDNTGGVPLNNGGSLEKVGLVRGPGPGIPAMFEVYMGGNSTPWNWSNGAVPAAQLNQITRVVVRVTSESRRPARDGQYTRQTLTTEINSIRNVPAASTSLLYTVSGYVYNDLNKNGMRELGEPGLPNVMMRLGTSSVGQTSSTGFYSMQGPPINHVLKQTVPPGFGPVSPDSFMVSWMTTPGDLTHDFADSARAGGFLLDSCWVDSNTNGFRDAGDAAVDRVTVTAGGQSDLSDVGGATSIFLSPGTHTVSYVAPESMTVVSGNPATVAITNGFNTVHYTQLTKSTNGTITGTVYRDNDKDGVFDTGEPGFTGVWVGVTNSSGAVVVNTTTDASGNYTLLVPTNMPAAVDPYALMIIPPDGFSPVGSTVHSPIWISVGQTLSGHNFGMSPYTVLTLAADRVLSLGSGNLLEKDWSGADNAWATKGSNDIDLVLGSEWVSNPNVSVWWNQYGALQIFPTAVSYQRNANSSALSVAVGPLDGNTPTIREDVVTGLARKPSGNLAVWLNQNSSSNLGYLVDTPSLYQTSDLGDANVVQLMDVGGTSALDVVVGTTGLANRGVVETWINNGNGLFARDEIYPNTSGNIPGGIVGEVKAIVFVDTNRDGLRDMVLGTKTASGYGKVLILLNISRTAFNRYKFQRSFDVTGEVTCMTAAYVDGDTDPDLVVGTRVSSVAGNIQYWRGTGSADFNLTQTYTAGGPVLSMLTADLGGTSRNDIVYGFRIDESNYAGGTRILFLDSYSLPPDDVDPAAGTQDWMAPAITANHFNYRINPTTGNQTDIDLAVAAKTGATTGSLIVITR
jgi:prepilin-type N-terminal cleavage/methylation domain-containing protein